MKKTHIIAIGVAIFVGSLMALITWTLIVKQAVQTQLDATGGTTSTLSSLASIGTALHL